MPEEGGGDCVKVAIRCRPPSKKEIANNEESIVEMNEAFSADGDAGQVVLNDPSGNEEPAKFAFDIVFGLSVMQSQVYESVGRPALAKTFEGYNGTIFAYGQTGSGKSFSMAGCPDPPELQGITPRMNRALFERIAEEQVGSRKFLVMCSYFEIYNEIIFDLLNPVADRGKLGGGLQIKEHPVMGIYVKDLTEIVAESAQKLEDMLESGQKNRAVSSTMMNSVSSRSHSIFTVKVHQKDDEDASKSVFAKLNLVDLAGSERQKGTGATGQTLKEGANINKSLSALGNVINALVECANGKKVFIPYRNSKLTRVLQESLGGNSLCTMLATLSPAACNYEETMSTLRYANRAKAIKVSATKNEEASQISRLKAEVEELKKKLASSGTGGVGGAGGLTDAEREAEKQKFEKQLKEMEQMMNSNWGEKAKLSEEHQRKMQRLAEERKRAAQAVEEERSRRLRLLQEKNDLELSVRALIDFLLHMPKLNNPPPVLTGDLTRQWLKSYRTLRQQMDELKEQRTLVLVFKHAFDEDVKLWGEGAEADDISLAATGLNRCTLKLEKLRKAGEKLLQLESQANATATELSDAVRGATVELERYGQTVAEEEKSEVQNPGETVSAKATSVEEVNRMLSLVGKQVQEKLDELAQQSSVEMGPTCEIVLQCSRSGSAPAAPEVQREGEALQALISDPSLASLPPGMPAKPLREYGAGDVSDTPETTEVLLGNLIRWEGLCGKTKKSPSELLARPPPKFILDVACAIKAATGFPPDFQGDWPDAREEKLARLQGVADAASAALGVVIDFFDPQDVLKGKEVPKTLRVLQMLAVAAARQGPAQSAPPSQPGVTRARELPAVLAAMGRCIRAAKEQVDARRQAGGAAEDGETGLEDKIAELERQLEEAKEARRLQEEALADTERQLEESKAEVKQVSNECELTKEQDVTGNDPELLELERQVEGLLRDAASPEAMPEGAVVSLLSSQIEEVKLEFSRDESEMAALEQRHEELQASLQEATAASKKLEAELLRERQRKETEQELVGQSPEEQKLILQAHEQKLRTRAGTLEAQINVMQTEAEERKAANLLLLQEGKDLEAKTEDAHLQMQIVQEERDAMRDAMERLWIEKATVDDELVQMEQGYINLSERLNSTQDEQCELQSLVEQKRQEVAGLQRNGFGMSSSHPLAGMN